MQYITVTQALKPYLDLSNVNPDYLDFTSERGRKVHRISAAIAQDIWVPFIPDYIKGYIESFQDWFVSQVLDVLFVERRFYDETYFISGQPDLVVRMRTEGLVVIDLKTPRIRYRVWAGQMAGYLHLVRINGYDARKSGSLQLDPKGGTAKLPWYEEQKADFAQLLNAVSAYRYFNERK